MANAEIKQLSDHIELSERDLDAKLQDRDIQTDLKSSFDDIGGWKAVKVFWKVVLFGQLACVSIFKS